MSRPTVYCGFLLSTKRMNTKRLLECTCKVRILKVQPDEVSLIDKSILLSQGMLTPNQIEEGLTFEGSKRDSGEQVTHYDPCYRSGYRCVAQSFRPTVVQ